MQNSSRFSRRDFIKVAGLGLGALAFNPREPSRMPAQLPQFPAGERLGRVAVTPNFYSTELKPQPDQNAPKIRDVPQDEIVVWNREVIGSEYHSTSRRWVETPDGFVYLPELQPVRNISNTPLTGMPKGKGGFWAEVTVPYVDLQILNSPISPAMKYLLGGLTPTAWSYADYVQLVESHDARIGGSQPVRLYYGQVIWVDQVGSQDGQNVLYHVTEALGHGSGYGDAFLADGAAFHVLTNEDVAPINPNVDPATKKIVVDTTKDRQTLSCFEGNSEVYFCKVSSGWVSSTEDDSTPPGDHSISWKTFSIHMAANTANRGGYDTMAVPWPVYFDQPSGAAIHGAFWHNDFGVRRSHGCVNASPEDAKWIFRWSSPAISLDQSEWRETDWTKVGGAFSTAVTVTEVKA